ncbi:MAG: NosD domain-containing protein, partial [Bacteroidota bacterium]
MKTILQRTIVGCLSLLLGAAMVKAELSPPTLTTEICYNGIDDNGDGLVDNEDPTCLVIKVTTTADVSDGDTRSVTTLLEDPGADGLISLREAIAATQSASSRMTFHTIGFDLKNFDLGHTYYEDDGVPNQVTEENRIRTTAIDDSTIGNLDPDHPRSWFQFFINSPLPALTDNVLIDGYNLRQATPNTNAFGTTLNTTIRIEVTASGNFPVFTIEAATRSTSELIIRGLCLNGEAGVLQIAEGSEGNIWIHGNLLGMRITALAEVQSEQDLITIVNSDRPVVIGSNRDGINDEQEVNLIAGVTSEKAGIALENTEDITISQNYFGVGLTGKNQLNDRSGSAIFSHSSNRNKIHGNIISFFEHGIQLENAQKDSILYNLIGTNTDDSENLAITANGGFAYNCDGLKIYKNKIANARVGWNCVGVLESHFVENDLYNNLTVALNLIEGSATEF